MKEYINVGQHVTDLASGQMIGIGETVTLSAADEREPHNARQIESGTLIAVEHPKEDTKKSSGTKAKEGDKE